MLLDGFVAQPDDNPAGLFDWYWSGDMVVPTAHGEATAMASPRYRPSSC